MVNKFICLNWDHCNIWLLILIEVEQPVTRLPPHRSLRAELPHKALQNCSLAHGTYLSPQKA